MVIIVPFWVTLSRLPKQVTVNVGVTCQDTFASIQTDFGNFKMTLQITSTAIWVIFFSYKNSKSYLYAPFFLKKTDRMNKKRMACKVQNVEYICGKELPIWVIARQQLPKWVAIKVWVAVHILTELPVWVTVG